MPPGMPKTTSQPTASSERTSDCAPVTFTGAPPGGAGLGRCPGGGAGTGLCLVLALVIGSASESEGGGWIGAGHEKTPADHRWSNEGWRVDERNFLGVDAPGNYEKVVQSLHASDVNGKDIIASNHAGRSSQILDARPGVAVPARGTETAGGNIGP
ncbi:hypothetical protein GCM10010470_10940 [Saccharopolyspora taberi]|uniref:Uncharacterized protein n=1 Tax=Saccharopolyspora taberi TaxID=60895 RepID=A0ABN3V6D0_9PSEU